MKQIITLLILLPIIMFSQCVPKDGCNNGAGTYTWVDIATFEGEWKNGKPWKGTYTWVEGDLF